MSCLKCLKYTMCVVNFVFFMCGAVIFSLAIYLKTAFDFSSLVPSFPAVNVVSALFILAIFITCVSFLGFLGALKENRCLLISFFILLFLVMLCELALATVLLMYEEKIEKTIGKELYASLENAVQARTENKSSIEWDTVQNKLQCCGVKNMTEWKPNIPRSCCKSVDCKIYWEEGCYSKMKRWFEENLLSTGIGVIIVCSIEVLGMCFSLTLFCHISKSGLGYK
ncbi:leukocyte surface antigen CD53-like [Hoplias malabaricus]|uniref:leukocyte surface antigen CD53-like n=1 Tax=Hoplias malabaricus TaxID=27720 RepID=UPI003462D603